MHRLPPKCLAPWAARRRARMGRPVHAVTHETFAFAVRGCDCARNHGCSSGSGGLRDSESLHHRLQRRALHAETCSSPSRAGQHPVRLFQRAEDIRPLNGRIAARRSPIATPGCRRTRSWSRDPQHGPTGLRNHRAGRGLWRRAGNARIEAETRPPCAAGPSASLPVGTGRCVPEATGPCSRGRVSMAGNALRSARQLRRRHAT